MHDLHHEVRNLCHPLAFIFVALMNVKRGNEKTGLKHWNKEDDDYGN